MENQNNKRVSEDHVDDEICVKKTKSDCLDTNQNETLNSTDDDSKQTILEQKDQEALEVLQSMSATEKVQEQKEEEQALQHEQVNSVDGNQQDSEEDNDDDKQEDEKKDEKKKSKYKFGIIYLSRIPPGRNYTRLRDVFSRYGEVGNIYLVPDKLANERLMKKGKLFKSYAEGFIEFKKKKVAKMVAELLNGQPIEKSKNGIKGFIWDIKYLHRVKWHHLMAKLKHTKALEEQRIRMETEKAKDAADHYLDMMNEWKRRERNGDFMSKDSAKRLEQLISKQRPTKKEFMELKQTLQKEREQKDMESLYSSLFS